MQVGVSNVSGYCAKLTLTQPVLLHGTLLNRRAFSVSWRKHLRLQNSPQRASCKILKPIGMQSNDTGDFHVIVCSPLTLFKCKAPKSRL